MAHMYVCRKCCVIRLCSVHISDGVVCAVHVWCVYRMCAKSVLHTSVSI